MYIVLQTEENEVVSSSTLYYKKEDAEDCVLDIAFKTLQKMTVYFSKTYLERYKQSDIDKAHNKFKEWSQIILAKPYEYYDFSSVSQLDTFNLEWVGNPNDIYINFSSQSIDGFRTRIQIVDTSVKILLSFKELVNITPFSNYFKNKINKWFISSKYLK